MFLIVESGSTKADWVVVTYSGDTHFYSTKGINPATQTSFYDLNENTSLLKVVREADNIWFYGAGVFNEMTKEKIRKWFASYGAQAKIEVESDMLGAARACSKNTPSVICILGTGSNSCVYDGYKIYDAIPSLGYILGDEGSGTHIGKEILRAYFCRKMPKEIQLSFESEFAMTRESLIEKVYLQNAGSSYIASFASFLSIAEESWKEQLLLKVFKEFLAYRVCTLADATSYPIHFVGSIAHYYQTYLTKALTEFGMNLGKVVQQPINELIDYHFKQTYK